MRESRRQLLEHVSKLAEEGTFGDSVRQASERYRELGPGLAVFLRVVDDFCEQNEKLDRETRGFRELMCQLLIVAYRDATRADPDAAEPFLSGLISDYPGAQESALLTRWCSLAQSCLAFREVSTSGNRLLVWQQMERAFIAYNEFLDGLLGFLLILLRTAKGRPARPTIFRCAYGDKVNQLNELTGGEDGAYYLLTRIARPAVRNAASHGRLWLDDAENCVRYVDGRESKEERSLPVVEFGGLVHLGSHLGMAYLAAIGTVVALDCGTSALRGLLPDALVKLWEFEP